MLSAITPETPNIRDFLTFFTQNIRDFETFLQQKKQKDDFLLNDKKYLCKIKDYYYFCFRDKKRVVKISLKTTNIKEANILKLNLIKKLNMSDDFDKKFNLNNSTYGVNTSADLDEDPEVVKELNDKIFNLISQYKQNNKIKTVGFNEHIIKEKTIKDGFDEFIEYKVKNDKIKDASVRKYTTTYKYLLLFCDENTPIYTFNNIFFKKTQEKILNLPANVLRLSKYKDLKYDEIMKDFNNTDYKKLENKTINEIFKGLNQFFIYFKFKDYIADNIVEYQPLKTETETYQDFTDEEIDTFFKYSKIQLVKDIFKIGLYTGMRIGEISNLKRENINFKENFIDINESKTKSGIRIIPIHREIEEIIKYYFDNPISDDYLFVKDGNKNILTKKVGREIRKFFDSDKKVFHSTRKCFAIRLYQQHQKKENRNKFDETIIKRLMGHDTSHNLTFDVYALKYMDKNLLREAIDLIEYESFKVKKVFEDDNDISLNFP